MSRSRKLRVRVHWQWRSGPRHERIFLVPAWVRPILVAIGYVVVAMMWTVAQVQTLVGAIKR